jgi:hypothetical protein
MCYCQTNLLFVVLLSSVVKDNRRLLDALFRFACCGAAELLGVTIKLRHYSFQIMWHCANRRSELSVDDAVKTVQGSKRLYTFVVLNITFCSLSCRWEKIR